MPVGTLPTVRNGSVALYPLKRSNLITTEVQRFVNASEQRWQCHAPLQQFELQYRGLFPADRDALKQFYADTKGAFDPTWSFTLPPNTYTTCTFLDDSFQSVENAQPGLYDVALRFRQVKQGGLPVGPMRPIGSYFFPSLSTAATTQRPFIQRVRYRTTLNDNRTGMRYSYAWYDAGLVGFPNRGLMGWTLSYPSISDADMAVLEGFFLQVTGRLTTFSFTDPDSGLTYPTVRFDQDAFGYTYVALGQASTTLQLVETNDSAVLSQNLIHRIGMPRPPRVIPRP
jgi:hypothetical protein